MQNTTTPNPNHTNPYKLWLKSSAPSVTKNIKTRSRSDSKTSDFFLLTSDFYLNLVNLVKILTVQISANLCLKFCISLSPQVVRPPAAEIFPMSIFVKNMQKSAEIDFQKLSKHGQKWSISCQKWVKSGPLLVKTPPLFDRNIQKSSEMFRNPPPNRS